MSQKLRFVKQQPPKFIQQFKQRVGLKHEPTLEDKVQNSTEDVEDLPEKDDEKPVVVVLKEGDLTSEEAATVETNGDDDDGQVDGKIKFRKPTSTKRGLNDPPGLSASSKKKTKTDKTESDKLDKKTKSKSKGKTSSSLLSFSEEDF